MRLGFKKWGLFLSIAFIVFLCLLNVIPAAAQTPRSVASAAIEYKKLFDTRIELVGSASVQDTTYYVIQYENRLPFASGIEVISERGTLVKNASTARSVFRSIGWQEAASYIKASDIDTLRNILEISEEIDALISPVRTATNYVIDAVDSLDGIAVNIPLIGRISAWDVVKDAYPQVTGLESMLRSLNDDLDDWGEASSTLAKSIPKAIEGLQRVAGGGELAPDLQKEVGNSISGLSTLKGKTDKVTDILADAISTLSSAENGLRRAADNKYVGQYISPIANYVGDLRDDVDSLRTSAQSFSSDLSKQQSKLSSITNRAQARENELYDFWSSRQDASTIIYALVGGIGGLLLLLTIIFAATKKGKGAIIFLVLLVIFGAVIGFFLMSTPESSLATGLISTPTPTTTTPPAPTTTLTPTPTPTSIPEPTPTPKPEMADSIAVQYASDDDYLAALAVAEEFGYELIKSSDINSLLQYDEWILLGSSEANPVYAVVFGELISLDDEGYIRIDHKVFSHGGKQYSVWGVASWLAQDTLKSAYWIVENGLPSGKVKAPWIVVQYASDDDYQVANSLAQARGWELVKTSDMSALEAYDGWVVVGAQLANPVYKSVFGSLINENDEGFIRISYKMYDYAQRSRNVWGIASWSAEDTQDSADWVIQWGLPSKPVRQRP
jgi:hypothetical protein